MGLFEPRESLTMRIANRRSQRAGSRTSQQPAVRPFHYHLCSIFFWHFWRETITKNQASNHGWNGKKHQEPEANSILSPQVMQKLDASQPANWTNTKPKINDRRADGVNCQTWHWKTGGDKAMGACNNCADKGYVKSWQIDINCHLISLMALNFRGPFVSRSIAAR